MSAQAVDTMNRRRTIKANGPVRLDRIAEPLLDPLVSKAGFSSTQILAAWAEIVGPELADKSRPEKLRWPPRSDDAGTDGGTLVVRAEGGDALELQYAASVIVERINAIFGWRAVARLAIRQAPVENGDLVKSDNRDHFAIAEQDIASNSSLGAIEDADLRAALARLGARIESGGDTKV
jgi:hypothetical protein